MNFSSPEKFTPLPQTSPEALLNKDLIKEISKSRVEGKFELTQNGQPIEIKSDKSLGAGGSKEVFDAEIGGLRYALAVPAAGIDPAEIIEEKWQDVLEEPGNTARLRQLGFYANEVCEILPIKINGFDFPALRMRRFQDLPYEVRDTKNPHSSTGNSWILGKEGTSELDQEKVSAAVKALSIEINSLIEQGVKLKRDSFNFCLDHDQPHLYFNDLGAAKFEEIAESEKAGYIKYYSHHAATALIMAPRNEEYNKIKDSIDYETLQKMIFEACT